MIKTAIFAILCIFFSFSSQASLMTKLVKRENIKGIKVVYADYGTYDYFENYVGWGARAYWGGIDNPFTKGEMDFNTFLETFGLLIPNGGYDGIKCTDLYRSGTDYASVNSTIQHCSVEYSVGGNIWTLNMLVNYHWAGNAYEDQDILTNTKVSLKVSRKQ